MKFVEVAQFFDQIEQESARLKITKILAELLKKASPKEAELISYFSLGNLNPIYIGTQFNFASKSMVKVLAKFLKRSESTIKKRMSKLGDLGLIVQEYDIPGPKDYLSVIKVAAFMREFQKISGEGATELKEKKLLEIFEQLDVLSIKYVIRIILGKLRLGFSDMTLLDAFSWMQEGDKSLRKELEDAYNVCVDIGLIVKELKEKGESGILNKKIVPGIPIRPAAAERLPTAKSIVKKLGKCVAQPKLDGFRLQVHLNKEKSRPEIHFFSRNLKDMSYMFPDLKKVILDLNVKTFIAEGEAIAFDPQTGIFLPFQETVKRKRKYDIEEMAKEFPLKLYLFDLLYLNGESMLEKSHVERRKELLKIFSVKKWKKQDVIFPIAEEKIDSAEKLEKYFHQNIDQGLEGVVVKKPDSKYIPGKRNFNWVKLKREETGHLSDTIDCVILGYYAGKGKRATFGIGALLVGLLNEKKDHFQTVAKIGTGLTDVAWRDVKKRCDKIKVLNKPKNVDCAKELYPDVWVSPEIVCLIRADEITMSPLHFAGKTEKNLGMALRFPRFMGYREDKSAGETTTVKELKELYSIQFKEGAKSRKHESDKKKKVGEKNLNIF